MSTDDRILDAAMRVVVEEGLRGATTRRIAEEAGVNEVTLFRRFGSKDHLLCEAFRRSGAEVDGPLPDVPQDPEAELTAWCAARAVHLHRSRWLIRSTLTEMEAHPMVCSAAHAGRRRLASDLASYLDRLRARGLARGDWDAASATRMLMGALFGEIVADPLADEDPRPFSPEDVAARYVPLLLRAIGADPPSDPRKGPAR